MQTHFILIFLGFMVAIAPIPHLWIPSQHCGNTNNSCYTIPIFENLEIYFEPGFAKKICNNFHKFLVREVKKTQEKCSKTLF